MKQAIIAELWQKCIPKSSPPLAGLRETNVHNLLKQGHGCESVVKSSMTQLKLVQLANA